MEKGKSAGTEFNPRATQDSVLFLINPTNRTDLQPGNRNRRKKRKAKIMKIDCGFENVYYCWESYYRYEYYQILIYTMDHRKHIEDVLTVTIVVNS